MFCSYRNCKKHNVHIREPTRHETNGSKYHLMNFQYKHEFEDIEIFDEFTVEGCEMEVIRGITYKTRYGSSSAGNVETSKFPIVRGTLYHSQRDDDKMFVKVINGVREWTAQSLFKFDDRLNRKYTANNVDEYLHPIILGDVKNNHVCIDFRLVPYLTIFTDLDGNEISHDLLEGTYMRIIPVIRFKHINVGNSSITVRIELIKAVVTYIQPEKYDQSSTMTTIKESRPNSASLLTNNLALLAKKKAAKTSNEFIVTVEYPPSEVLFSTEPTPNLLSRLRSSS